MIYLDNAATFPVLDCAFEEFHYVLTDMWGNPNSVHAVGVKAREYLDRKRNELSELVGCYPDEIYFTSGATEACNWAVQVLDMHCVKMFCSDFEHHAVLDPYDDDVRYYCVDTDTPKYEKGCCVMLANNETGDIFEFKKKNDGYLVFSDATAYIGHLPFDFHKHDEIDYLAFGAHKFGGVPGCGALLVKTGRPLSPFILGGGQQDNLRAGTQAVALIAAMVEALKYRTEHMKEHVEKCVFLRDRIIKRLLAIDGSHLNGSWTPGSVKDRLPDNVNISFRGIEGSSLVNALSKEGIMISSGSACNSSDNKPSHVLKAMGYDDDISMGAIRITLSGDESIEEIDYAIQKIEDIVRFFKNN